MAHLRVHLDHLGVERVEIVPEGRGLTREAFKLAGALGGTIIELDRAVRIGLLFVSKKGGHSKRKPAGAAPTSKA